MNHGVWHGESMEEPDRRRWAAAQVVEAFQQVHGLTEAHLKLVAALIRTWPMIVTASRSQGRPAPWPPKAVRDARAAARDRSSTAIRTLELLAPSVAAATGRAREHLALFPDVPCRDGEVPEEVRVWVAAGEELVESAKRDLRAWLGLPRD